MQGSQPSSTAASPPTPPVITGMHRHSQSLQHPQAPIPHPAIPDGRTQHWSRPWGSELGGSPVVGISEGDSVV